MNVARYIRIQLYRLRESYRQFRYARNMEKQDVHISELGCHIAMCSFEGKNVIGANTSLNEVKMGYASYVGEDCNIKWTCVGRFCSIGNRVTTAIGNHPTDSYVSTHPAFYSLSQLRLFGYVKEKKYDEWKWVDREGRVAVQIGNDVWIANNSVLCEGVRIGDGAVVCAGSIVVKDVPPYAVVGGAPAGIIRYRFSEDMINKLIAQRIWDKPYDWYKINAMLFSDVEQFIESMKGNN